MSIKTDLCDTKIKNLKPGLKTKRITDRDGLYLEVRPSKSKVFIYRFQWNKKPQTITLGHYPALMLSEARSIVSRYDSWVKNGIDPRKAEASCQEQVKSEFKSIAQHWYDKNSHCWRLKTQNKHIRSLERDIYPFIGSKQIHGITKLDILELIRPHEALGHHELAHRLFSRIKAIFDYALAADLTDNYPLNGLIKALAPKPKVKSQKSINPKLAHEMLKSIKESNSCMIINMYPLLLSHLFTRPSELRLAQWSEFDLQNAEWHIPTDRMKMNNPHWVPLSQPVITMLKELKLMTAFSPFLFNSPNSKRYQPISETSARKLLYSLGYKGLHTLHGFRSLASSVLHEHSTFRMDAIESQLAHKVHGVRGVYMRADFKQERRELMNWYSNWLLGNKDSPGIKINNSAL